MLAALMGMDSDDPKGRAPVASAGASGGARDDRASQERREAEARALRPEVSRLIACILHLPAAHADVDDAANETMRRAFERRDDHDERDAHKERDERGAARGPFSAWVMGIARHVALDVIRRKRRERARAPLGADAPPPSTPGAPASSRDAIDRIAGAEEAPEDAVARVEMARKVRRALLALEPKQRRAVELFHLEGKSYREISETLRVPVGTVATWVMRGRKALLLSIGGDS
jgi:RNA polymerase sigma-70 factor (ECF subfamily)